MSKSLSPLLAQLNPEQRRAVEHSEGPLLVLAGAGSGKTRVIVHRIAHLILELGVRPWQILAVTFTNKAAGEMRERLAKVLADCGSAEAAADCWVSTFHALGASILRRDGEALGLTRGFTIYDDDDQVALAKRIFKEANREADTAAARELLSAIDRQKNGMQDGPLGESTRGLVARYQAALRAANAVDFGDLLALPLELFEKHPQVLDKYQRRFSHLLVDEFQDTNEVQYRLLRLLASSPAPVPSAGPSSPPNFQGASGGNLCVVGDDDQSIYRWRGAEVGNILGFETDYPKAEVVRLTQNYRSDGNILAAAAAVIAHNPHRHVKELWTTRPAGAPLSVLYASDERDEAARIARGLRELNLEGIAYGQMAIFFRINAQSRVLEEALRVARVPYVIVRGRSFYERAEIKDAIAYLRLAVNPRSDVDLLRVINSPARGIGETTLDRLSAHARSESLAIYDALTEPQLSRVEGLNGGARGRLLAFRQLLEELAEVAQAGSAGETAQEALKRSGMLERLAQLAQTGGGPKAEEAEERHENLMEFVNAAREADERAAVVNQGAARAANQAADGDLAGTPLQSFLEQVALIGDADGAGGGERVSVMTLHAAKGLEFEVVVIAGLEEGIFPHSRALKPLAAPEEMHEERRLAYVGFTRARHRLILAASFTRALFGEVKYNPISRFLRDVPAELLDQRLPAPAQREDGWRRSLGSGSAADSGGYRIDRSYDQSANAYGDHAAGTPRYGRSDLPLRRRPLRAGPSVAEWQAQRKVVTLTRVESLDWPHGTVVAHPTFGLGRILAADGEGGEAKLTVRFQSVGDKRIVAKYLKRA